MKTHIASHSFGGHPKKKRGSVLITALIFSLLIVMTLLGYMRLSTSSLFLAHRTFFANEANNLAEAGTEEAMWSFNQMGNSSDSTVIANAWTGWTLTTGVADVYMQSIGTGYSLLNPPTVTFSGGSGSGATGTPNITTGYDNNNNPITSVSGITITNPGSGYTSPPTVTLSGGSGSGAIAIARFAATRTFNFPTLDQNASGVVKVWVAGYNGTSIAPIVVAKATITPVVGTPIEKTIKIILSKNGVLPKGVIARNAITWNGHPIADSFLSSAVPGVPPFSPYDPNTARSNMTVGSVYGPTIDLGAQGIVDGNVMFGITATGAPVTVTQGNNSVITGQVIPNLTYNFTMPTYPTNSGATAGPALGNTVPAVLPRAGDPAAGDGNYYYYTNGATIGTTTITAGKKVVIVGTNTNMVGGLQIGVSGTQVGAATIYMDGTMSPGNSNVNTTSWAGALNIYTTTTGNCAFSGNAQFNGCLFAPNASLTGNGGGNNEMDLCGSFIVGSVTSNGHMCFHYDEGLSSATNPRAWSLALWTELQSSTDRQRYASQLNF